MPAVKPSDLSLSSTVEGSNTIAHRVAKARSIQRQRFIKNQLFAQRLNADASGKDLETILTIHQDNYAYLIQAAENLKFSARSFHRILRVARTIADLNENEVIQKSDIAEALSLRFNVGNV